MKHFLIITNASGETERREVRDGERIPVEPGDDVVVVDENGEPADVRMKSEGDDLVLEFEAGETVSLSDFYAHLEQGEPITVGVSPTSNNWAEYEFNSQVGNLPGGSTFTLMRLSNTEYVDFDEQTEPLDDWVLVPFDPQSRLGGGDPGDEPPEALPDEAQVSEDGIVSISLLANDSDPEGSALQVVDIDGRNMSPGRTVVLDSGATVTLLGNGAVKYEPGPGFDYLGVGESATDVFTYTIEDDSGNRVSSTATITVNGENDGPIAQDDTALTSEEEPVTIDPLANDEDPDASDTLTLIGVTQPSAGEVTLHPDNTLTFDPGDDFQYLAVGETAITTVVYTVSDDEGATATATVTFTVSGENDTPVAVPEEVPAGEDEPINIDVVANDTDPDASDELEVCGIEVGGVMVNPTPGVPITLDSGATVTLLADGTLTYEQNGVYNYLDEGETAIDVFTYKIDDGNGGTATSTTTVTVIGEDDVTVTAPDEEVTSEENPATIDVLANDVDADTSDNPLSITNVTQPPAGQGTVVNNGTDVTFDPGADFQDLAVGETEIVTFTYDATTPDGDTVTETVTVTVTGENDGPVADNDSVSCGGLVGGASLLPVDGTFESLAGVASSDGFNNNVGGAGWFNGQGSADSWINVTTAGNGVWGGLADGMPASPDGGVFAAAGNWTSGGEAFYTDISGLTVGETYSVKFYQANAGIAGTTPIGEMTGWRVQFGSDEQFAPKMPYLGEGNQVWEEVTLTFTATAETQRLQFFADDDGNPGNGGASTEYMAVDGIQVLAGGAATADCSALDSIDVLANDTDIDGDELNVTHLEGTLVAPGIPVTLASGATVTLQADKTVRFDKGNIYDYLDAGESATDIFTYTIDDGNGGTDTASVTVTITGEDDATVTAPDEATIDEDTPVTIDVLANDSDVDTSDNPLSVTNVVQPPKGTVMNNGTDVTFDPGADFQDLAVGETDVVTFTYDATTPDGDTVTETVTVTVTGTNDTPVANPDTIGTPEDTPISIDPLDNDTDPDGSDELEVCGIEVGGVMVNPTPGVPITLDSGAVVTLLADGTLTYEQNGVFDYLDAGESAVDVFTYKIDDGNGGTATSTTSVTVTGEDDVTVTAPDVASSDEDTPVTIDVLANDSDADASDNPLSVTNVVQPPKGTVVNNGTDVTFDPGADFQDLAVGETDVVTFTYDATTPDGDTVTETVTVTVTGGNDAPVANPDVATVTEDDPTPLNIDVTANDTDTEGDPLEVCGIEVGGAMVTPVVGVPITLDSGAVVTLQADGTLNYEQNGVYDSLDAGESAVDVFTYKVDDGNGGTATATTSVTVTGEDDATVTNPDTATTGETTPVTIDVLANDSDADTSDNPLSITNVTQPPAGQGSVVNNGGDLTFDPGSDFDSLGAGDTEIVTFTYDATTPDGDTVTETVTVTVTGGNDAPVANPDVATVTEDDPTPLNIDVTANDTDTEGDPLEVCGIEVGGAMVTPTVGVPITLDSGAVVTLQADGTLDYEQNGAFDGLDNGETAVDVFTYKVDDGNGGTDTSTVSVTVNGVTDNAAPTAVADTYACGAPTGPSLLAIDGSFESLAGVASSDGFNNNVTGAGWFNGQGSADSWINVTTAGSGTWGGLADGTPDSPDGGVFAAAGNWTTGGESFYTDLTGLTVGQTYTIKFYQSNVGMEGTTPIGEMTGWRVQFGGQEQFTTKMPYLGEGNQVWEEVSLVFTATGTTQRLEFFADDDGDPANPGASTEYMGVDGIRVEEGDTSADCPFANMNLTGNDTDPDGDPLSIIELEGGAASVGVPITLASGNTVTLNADGTVTYDDTPAPLAAGATDTFSYTISDSNGGTDTATVTLEGPAAPASPPPGTYGNLSVALVVDESGSIAGAEIADIRAGLNSFIASEVDSGNRISLIGMSATDTDARSDHILETEITAANQSNFTNWVNDYRGGRVGNQNDYWASGLEVAAGLAETPDVVILITDGAQGSSATASSHASSLEAAGAQVFAIGITNGSYFGQSLLSDGVAAVIDPTPVQSTQPDLSDILASDYDANATFSALSTQLSGLTATLQAAFAPPVVVDLDGDGVEYDSVDEGIAIDADGDGEKEQTAWADEDDAVLIFDANENSVVDGRSEFAFADYSDDPNATDMEGLRAHFDTDSDGLLTANDEQWDRFRLWQDRDGDGEVGEGEMITLEEAGIESIGLVSDGASSIEAGGDVRVHGESEVSYSDGSTGIAADASFRFEELLDSGTGQLEALTESGEVIDLNGANEELPGEALAPEDLAGSGEGGDAAGADAPFEEGGALASTAMDDDAAAAQAQG